MDIDFDGLYTRLGKWGRWQRDHMLGGSAIWLHGALSTIFIVIAGNVPDHWCALPADSNSSSLIEHENCDLLNITSNKTMTCVNGFVYNATNYKSSLVSEWDLVCDNDFLPQMSQTFYMGGQALGSYAFTIISDKFGRKRSYLGAHVLLIFLEIAGSFVPGINWFVALRFFSGVATMGACTTLFVLTIEMFPPSENHVIGVWAGILWSVAICLGALLSYVMKDISWRYMHLTLGCVFLPVIYQIWTFDESIRWLCVNNRFDEAHKIVCKAARKNIVSLSDIEKYLPLRFADDRSPPDVSQKLVASNKTDDQHFNSASIPDAIISEKLNIFDILKHPKLRRHLLLSWVYWSTQSLTYYGLTLMANELAGDRFLNLFLYGIVDIPAQASLIILLRRIGRKRMYAIYMIPCSICLLIATIFSTPEIDRPVVTTVFFIIAKLFIGAPFTVIWVYFPELYPTNLRSTGLGSASASARIAGMIAPFAGYMIKYIPWGPGAIFSAIGFISCLLLLLLPETRNKPLIQSVAEIDSLYKSSVERKLYPNNT